MEENRKRKNAQEEQSAGNQPAKKERKPRKKRSTGKTVGIVIGTLCLVGVLTAAMFVGIFMTYVNTVLKGHVEVDLTEYTQEVSTELYYTDPDTGEQVMYQTLFANQNRIWVDSEDIPEMLKKATIAIEDKRYETHKGVDWKGTLRAVLSTVTGGDVQGGSTITQQLIKNITGNKDNTVRRKVTEVYRALALEKEGYSKDELLTIYLNTIYLGNQCYGVKTAADMYFNKDITELTLAECATLISITNNPSMYDPLRADWCREENRNRQILVLECMLDQQMIDQATFDAAYNEEVVFSNGWTNHGNQIDPPEAEGGDDDIVVSTANNSYFTDAVIDDVADALVTYYGIEDDPADADGYVRTAHEKAVEMVYGKGLKIYTTQNPKYQEIAETVFENTDYTDYTDSFDQPLQAAITLLDPFTGNVLAMVGGTGAKEYDRGWNWATETRQCGSAIKPIATYAPALDNGTIHTGSVVDDYPIYLSGHGVYPRNDYGTYDGLITVQQALRVSSNCAAVKVNQLYGTAASYNFMTEKLGFTTLTYTDSEQVGNMALGGLEYGVTTEEMAAAFGAFVNDGIYTRPRTFSRIEANDGTLLVDNTPVTNVAMKESTAYLMRNLLQTVVSSGTGTAADFYGQPTAGKTGTTDANRDRYFVGFTPYYCAAVWCGYKSNEVIWADGNPSANLWGEVMSRVHEDLERGYFHDGSGVTTVSVCQDSGMLASAACAADQRGSRVRSVTVTAQYAPSASCTVHKAVSYCEEGKHVATEFCPKEKVKELVFLDYARPLVTTDNSPILPTDLEEAKVVKAADHQYLMSTITKGELCPVHKEAPKPPEPVVPEVDPNAPVDPNKPVDGTTKPPAGGDTTTPPAGGDTTTPPSGGDTTTPPAGGDTTTPPAGGGTATPPAARTLLDKLQEQIQNKTNE